MVGAFSAKSIIKTGLRNKMGDDWMNHRMVCYIERDVFVSIEESKIMSDFKVIAHVKAFCLVLDV